MKTLLYVIILILIMVIFAVIIYFILKSKNTKISDKYSLDREEYGWIKANGHLKSKFKEQTDKSLVKDSYSTSSELNDCYKRQDFKNISERDITVVDGEQYSDNSLDPSIGTVLSNKDEDNIALFNSITFNTTIDDKDDWIIYLLSDFDYNDSGTKYLSEVECTSDIAGYYYQGQYSYDDCGSIKLNYYKIISEQVWLTNSDWNNGLGNTDTIPVIGESFWVLDYGRESGRWNVNTDENSIYQTSSYNKYSSNGGSRAFPSYCISYNPFTSCSYTSSSSPCTNLPNGVAFTGCWQISIKCGYDSSNDNWCETFYLAERKHMTPGYEYYKDGSGGYGGDKYGREIDIMETHWHTEGPQVNLPTGDGTGWDTNSTHNEYNNWSNWGGSPMTQFGVFGVLIRDDQLWFYGYSDEDSQSTVYAYEIDKSNDDYDQDYPFVPYIGSWMVNTDWTDAGDITTGYRNFVYLEQDNDSINGYNPIDNPDKFGGSLIS